MHRMVGCAEPPILPAVWPGINEDVLARLKAAEDEAAMLRKQLAAAQQKVQMQAAQPGSHSACPGSISCICPLGADRALHKKMSLRQSQSASTLWTSVKLCLTSWLEVGGVCKIEHIQLQGHIYFCESWMSTCLHALHHQGSQSVPLG